MIGLKKTMVFYIGKAPAGSKTKWKMNEYRAIEQAPDQLTGNIPKVRISKILFPTVSAIPVLLLPI